MNQWWFVYIMINENLDQQENNQKTNLMKYQHTQMYG